MFVETKKDGEIQIPQEPWRKLLINAAEYIEQCGLCKGMLSDDKGSVCALGAFYYTTGLGDEVGEAVYRLALYLKLPNSPICTLATAGLHPVAVWSDAPERTQADVVAALRGAACAQGKFRPAPLPEHDKP